MNRTGRQNEIRSAPAAFTLWVWLFALTIRLLHLASIPNDPVADILVLDSWSYDRLGCMVASGEGMPDEVYFQAPFYPYFLGTVYRIAGRNLDVVRLIQMILDSLSVVFIFLLTRGILDFPSAVCAAAGMSLYPVLIFQSGLILKTTLLVFMFSLVLYLMAGTRRISLGWISFFGGGALGIAASIQGSAIFQLPVIGIYIVVRSGFRNILKWGAFGICAAAGFFLAVSPFTIRNYLVSGEFALLTAQGGANFYLGNSPFSDGTSKRPPRIRMTPEHEQLDFHREAENALGRKLSAHESSRYWFNEAIQWMKEHPGHAFRLQLRKFALFWNRVEIPDNYDFDFYRRYSVFIRYPKHPFLIPGVLGIIGMGLLVDRWKRIWLLVVWTVVFSLTVTTFHVYSRYRLPVVVSLMPLASGASVELVRLLRNRRYLPVIMSGAAAVVLIWFMSLKLTGYTHAQSLFNLGAGLTRQGDESEAVQAYQQALDLVPDYSPALINLGKLMYRSSDSSRALEYWNRALQIDPDSEELHNNLGKAAVDRGDLHAAEFHFEEAVRIQPHYYLGWLHLGQIKIMQAKYPQAVRMFDAALRLKPGDPQALFGRAQALEAGGFPDCVSAWQTYIDAASHLPSEQQYINEAQIRILKLKGQSGNEN
ncbi:tetratricopeptide repeat protein [bacterium]|nr:tetratricopeptide repeat protein [candidate division CSSED10-310 bacterium]